jgi:hypothetical protein
MAAPDWHRVKQFEQSSANATFTALDRFAEDNIASRLRFRSGDDLALALDMKPFRSTPGSAAPDEGWVLVPAGTLSQQQLERLQRTAQASLPTGQNLSHTARFCTRTGGSDELLVPGAGVCLKLKSASVHAPTLGGDTQLRKLPEGPIGNRESWFRGRSGKKGDK